MPSGAKKRKAAKKRKQNQPNNQLNPSSASTHTHGVDEVKHQDDKESDVGEVSSPASQDHHSHHNGEEEEIEEGVKIKDAEGTIIPVEREFEIEDESDKKNGSFEHDESARKSYDGGSSGSSGSGSSSSSDDESHGIENTQALTDVAPISVKVADSLPEEQSELIHGTIIEEASDSVVENVPVVVSEKISLSGEKDELDMSSLDNNSGAPSIVESVYKENGNKRQISLEDQVVISETITQSVENIAAVLDANVCVAPETDDRLSPSNNVPIADANVCVEQLEDRVVISETIIQSVENIAAVPDSNVCVAPETDDRLSPSNNAPIAAADNGVYADKDSGVTEPLLVPAPHPVQTSWKSCCGLFDLFTGSGR